jgi:uncharacterized protein YxjI
MISNQFPIRLTFKIGTFSNDFVAQNANGETIVYVRQKLLKLIEQVDVFESEAQSELLYTIRANRWIDFTATYTFTNKLGTEIGRIVRKGWSSLWKAHYEIYDEKQLLDLTVREENPWAKVFDSLLSEIPILGIFTGYLFNPKYNLTRQDGTLVCSFKKNASFFGRKFTLNKEAEFEDGEEDRILLGMMMMVLLERRRG